jgi:hypothetical protein
MASSVTSIAARYAEDLDVYILTTMRSAEHVGERSLKAEPPLRRGPEEWQGSFRKKWA